MYPSIKNDIPEEILKKFKDHNPISRLYITGSNRIIKPYPLENKKSWLEDALQMVHEIVLDFEVLEDVARALQISPNYEGQPMPDDLRGLRLAHLPIFRTQTLEDEDLSESPRALLGKVQNNGVLHLVAIFNGPRLEVATVSGFEIEWLNIDTPQAPLDSA